MSDESLMHELFDRWERVWHEGQYDLVRSCVADSYIRHGDAGDRTVTPESYAAEIAKMREERPNLRFASHDHSFVGDRAWVRFTFKWTDLATGEARSQAGMQVYRIENGKLAETWLMLSPLRPTWTDPAKERWTD
jgi:hypothetical protein